MDFQFFEIQFFEKTQMSSTIGFLKIWLQRRMVPRGPKKGRPEVPGPTGPKEREPKERGPKKGAQRKGTIFIDGYPSMIFIDGPSMNIIDGCPSMNINDGCPSMDFQFFEIQFFDKNNKKTQ